MIWKQHVHTSYNINIHRDDMLSSINNNYSSDFPPPLLVAIQFRWSYGAVQLLLHGADPATHWKNKSVYVWMYTSTGTRVCIMVFIWCTYIFPDVIHSCVFMPCWQLKPIIFSMNSHCIIIPKYKWYLWDYCLKYTVDWFL